MVKFDPSAKYDSNTDPMKAYLSNSKDSDKFLVNKKTNEITKIDLSEGEWLNHMIVWFKLVVFKTDSTIETVFQEQIRKEYKTIKEEEKLFQASKAKSDGFLVPKLQILKGKVEKLNSLIKAEAEILPETHKQDKYVVKAKNLETKILGEAFVNDWSKVKDVNKLKSKDLDERAEYFKNGFEFLKKHSDEIKQMIRLPKEPSKEDIAARDKNPFYISLTNDLNIFLIDYQEFITARFQDFDKSLNLPDKTDSVSSIVNQISDFHASIQGNSTYLEDILDYVTLESLNLRLLALKESTSIGTGEDYENTIKTIESHFEARVKELSAERSEAQKVLLQHEIASKKKSLPSEGAIKNLTREIESYKSSVIKLMNEIESLKDQEEELQAAVSNKESLTGMAGDYLRAAVNSIVVNEVDATIENQLENVKAELTLKTKNLNSLSDEILQYESAIDAYKTERAEVLSELPPTPQISTADTMRKINEINDELGSLLELPILAGNVNLQNQLRSLGERAFSDLRDINISWLKLSENPKQLKAKEQDQYIADGCKALSKLGSMSPEGRKLTKENIDAVKFFKDSHEMLLSRNKAIDTDIRNSLNQDPPDTKAVIRSLQELGDLQKAYVELNKVFYNKNMGNLYQYNFVQSPERIAADFQNDKFQVKLNRLVGWVENEQGKLMESKDGIEYQEKTNGLKSNMSVLASQLKSTQENIKAVSEELESGKQKKVELDRSLQTGIEEFTYSPLPGKWKALKDSLIQSEADYNSAIQSLEGFIKKSGLKTSAEAVTSNELREALVGPLVKVYREEQAAVPEGYMNEVISSQRSKINSLNREIKGAIEARDKNNAEVRKNIEAQKEEAGKLIRSNAVKLEDLKSEIRNQEAIIVTQTETLKQLEQTRVEIETRLSSQTKELNTIQNGVDEYEADLNAIQDSLKGLLGL